MEAVARSAGCSRATLYRYFADRQELQLAYVHREARRIGAVVARETASLPGGEDRLVTAVLAALRLVRSSPPLVAWFESDGAALTASLVGGSQVMQSFGLGYVGDELASRWLLRVMVMLLVMPGTGAAEEREMVERFVAPLHVG